LVVAFISALIGAFYVIASDGRIEFGLLNGLVNGGAIAAFELYFVYTDFGRVLRRATMPVFLSVTMALYVGIVLVSLGPVSHWAIVLGLETGDPGRHDNLVVVFHDLVFALGLCFTVNLVMRFRSVVGGRVLVNILFAQYRRPTGEDRVFLFIDLVESGVLAERLGDEKAQLLIARFFYDIAKPISAHGGEVHRYVGDEVVITWPVQEALEDGKCLRCVMSMRDRIEELADSYNSAFGASPRFRAGLHGGSVVASEVGEDRREIVYFGAAINTAARLEKATRDFNREWFVSGDLLRQMNLPGGIRAESIGRIALKTNEQPVEAFALPLFDVYFAASKRSCQNSELPTAINSNQTILESVSSM
jgi:adenylate cyclase